MASDGLNVRSGAGASFALPDQLAIGDRVAILAGPINAGGYDWYQVQFGFAEWPSADYPLVGWSAAAGGSMPSSCRPWRQQSRPSPPRSPATGRASRFSPNGDGVMDSATVTFALASVATDARLDVLNTSGATVVSLPLGALPAGPQAVSWDGRLGDSSSAPGNAYC